jgi:hypothetical protein
MVMLVKMILLEQLMLLDVALDGQLQRERMVETRRRKVVN